MNSTMPIAITSAEPPIPAKAFLNYEAATRLIAARGHLRPPEGELMAFLQADKPFIAGTPNMDTRAQQAIAAALRPETRLVSLQLVNNETGVVQDVAGTAAACRAWRGSLERGEPFFLHVDAVQALGKMPLRAAELGADLVTLSSHKVGGPKGAGALWARSGSGYLPPRCALRASSRSRPISRSCSAGCSGTRTRR